MYVKATHSDGTTSTHEVPSGEVFTGFGFYTEQPDAKTVLGLSDWNFSAYWIDPETAHGRYVTEEGPAAPAWELRWARWIDDNGWVGVITGYQIYLLSDQGKTIDKV